MLKSHLFNLIRSFLLYMAPKDSQVIVSPSKIKAMQVHDTHPGTVAYLSWY